MQERVLGIVGAGRMGSMVAQVAAEHGFKVVLVDIRESSVKDVIKGIRSNLEERVASGELTESFAQDVLGRIKGSSQFSDLKGTELCLEIVIDNENIKSYIHQRLIKEVSSTTIVATNTLSLSIEGLASNHGDPSRFLGVLFGFPPDKNKDVKIIPSSRTSPETISRLRSFLEAMDRRVVIEPDKNKSKKSSFLALQFYCAALQLGFLGLIGGALWGIFPSSWSLALGAIGIVGSFVCIFAMLALLKGSCRRLGQIVHAITAVATDDLSVDVPHLDRHDELGSIARIVDVFKRVTAQHDKMCDFSEYQREQEEGRRKEIERVSREFDKNITGIVGKVAREAADMQQSAKNLTELSNQTIHQTEGVAAVTEKALSRFQKMSAASESFAASAGEISQQVTESERISLTAVEEARKTDATVSTLSEAAAQIGDVLNLIRDIAEQTNLLALNATIEAARAGEAGKGFAVVASEVKNLASQTGRATEDISRKIETVQTVTNQAVEAIRSIGSVIERVHGISGSIAQAVEKQSTSTKELSSDIQEVSSEMSEMVASIQNVRTAADQSRHAAEEVLGVSTDLSVGSKELNVQIAEFLKKVEQK